MADNKKYYWFKFKEDFFRNKIIKKLRKIAGGDTYTIIYLEMQLLSLKNGGVLIFEGVEDTFADELALELDEDVENVKVTLMFLLKNGLIEETENDHYILPETINCIGSEGASAERVRRHRKLKSEKQKALQCNTSVTTCNTEIDIEKDIDKDLDKEKKKDSKKSIGEYKNVKLTEKELQSLRSDYGDDLTKQLITYLDEYIEMKGYKAKSHYLCIKKWVIKAVKEQGTKKGREPIRKEIVPEWFDKRIEKEPMSPEEQAKIDELFAQFKQDEPKTVKTKKEDKPISYQEYLDSYKENDDGKEDWRKEAEELRQKLNEKY